MPARIDPPVLFPAPRGGYIDGERFREHDWPYAQGDRSPRAEDDAAHLRDLGDRWLKRTDDQLRAAFHVYDEANGHGFGH